MRLLICLLFCGVVGAAGPRQFLRGACEAAEGVVVGHVVRREGAEFVVRVEAVVAGPVTKGSVVTVRWPGSLVGAMSGDPGYRGIWFLRRGTPWEILPIGGLKAPVFASALVVAPGELGTFGGGCFDTVVGILRRNAAHVDESSAYFTAMDMAGPELGRFGPDAPLTVRALDLRFGIERGEVGSLEALVAQAEEIGRSRVRSMVWLAVAGWRKADPAGVAVLGRLALEAGEIELNRAAAGALAMVHTKEAVPDLLRLLGSADGVLRWAAIRGLSEYVRVKGSIDSGIGPYVTVFQVPAEREAEFVAAWVLWGKRMAGLATL